MEYLETKGVPVIGYQTDELPAFFTRESGVALTSRADTRRNSTYFKAKQDLHLEGGMVIANPVPEKDELPKDYIDAIIDDAVKEAKVQGIHGKDSTPFLLKTIVEKLQEKFTNKY